MIHSITKAGRLGMLMHPIVTIPPSLWLCHVFRTVVLCTIVTIVNKTNEYLILFCV